MTTIRFKTTLRTVGTWTIVRLPESASAQLPSRGQVMVAGTINGLQLQTPLEPDGKGSHWFRVTAGLGKAAGKAVGDTVTLEIAPIKDWPEPEVPKDWQAALATDAQVHDLWGKITPLARWEWIRWMRATGKQETRERRIKVGISKLKADKRRPCCWNRNMCTEPSVCKNGILLDS